MDFQGKDYAARCRGTLYFFPALLPLAELAPLLLALLGAATGATKILTPAFWRRYKWPLLTLLVVCIGAAIALYVNRMPDKETAMAGTRAIDPTEFLVPQYFAKAAPRPVASPAGFMEIWSVPTKEQILSTPLIMDDILIFGSYSKTIEAISLRDGMRVWTLPQKAPVFSLTAGADNMVYAENGLHFDQTAALSAIDPLTGKTKWQREFLGHLEEKITIDPDAGMLWLGVGPGGLWALATEDGRVKWHKPLGHIDCEPLLKDGVIYVPAQVDENTFKSVFYALKAKSGDVLWTLDQPGQPWGIPITDKTGRIILTSTGIGQIGVERDTDKGWAQGISVDGKLLWEVELPGTPVAPAVYIPESDIVIYTTKNGVIIALKASDGTMVWQEKVGHEFHSGPTLIEGYDVPMVASTSYEGIFTIRDGRTGQEFVRRMVGTGVNSSPVIHNDVVYATSAYKITAFAGLHSLGGSE